MALFENLEFFKLGEYTELYEISGDTTSNTVFLKLDRYGVTEIIERYNVTENKFLLSFNNSILDRSKHNRLYIQFVKGSEVENLDIDKSMFKKKVVSNSVYKEILLPLKIADGKKSNKDVWSFFNPYPLSAVVGNVSASDYGQSYILIPDKDDFKREDSDLLWGVIQNPSSAQICSDEFEISYKLKPEDVVLEFTDSAEKHNNDILEEFIHKDFDFPGSKGQYSFRRFVDSLKAVAVAANSYRNILTPEIKLWLKKVGKSYDENTQSFDYKLLNDIIKSVKRIDSPDIKKFGKTELIYDMDLKNLKTTIKINNAKEIKRLCVFDGSKLVNVTQNDNDILEVELRTLTFGKTYIVRAQYEDMELSDAVLGSLKYYDFAIETPNELPKIDYIKRKKYTLYVDVYHRLIGDNLSSTVITTTNKTLKEIKFDKVDQLSKGSFEVIKFVADIDPKEYKNKKLELLDLKMECVEKDTMESKITTISRFKRINVRL